MASRIGSLLTGDSTGAGLVHKTSAPAYAATLALTPDAYKTHYRVAQLTGAMTINLTVTESHEDDIILFSFSEDSNSGGRVVTFGTGFESAGTLTVAEDKYATAMFVFNGTSFIEVSRAITA